VIWATKRCVKTAGEELVTTHSFVIHKGLLLQYWGYLKNTLENVSIEGRMKIFVLEDTLTGAFAILEAGSILERWEILKESSRI